MVKNFILYIMSDTSLSIVPSIGDFPNRKQKAKLIIDWLVNVHAVKSSQTDCVLGSDLGYPIDSGAKNLTDEVEYLPFRLMTNGLDVIVERQIYDTGQNGMDSFICPKCNEDIISDGWSFLDEYFNTGNSMFICPVCKRESDLNNFVIDPIWGFSNLGFTFWNWPSFKDEVLKEFEDRLGCKVKVVYSHI